MEIVVGKFVLLYLLMPVIALILGGVMFMIAKKNKLLSDKKTIFYFLLTCVILTLPALSGFIDYRFMPYAYIALSSLYLILGYFNLDILKGIVKSVEEKPYYVEFLCVLSVMFVGAALFSLVFNLCNELQYGLWACTCMLTFIFPSLFLKAYQTYLNIPPEVYLVWSYDEEGEITSEYMDYNKIIVIELELFKKVSDAMPLNIKAKASDNVPFGVWFKKFVNDYNLKSPAAQIEYSDESNSYGWIFYVNSSILGRKKYIDPGSDFMKNRIKEKNIIIAKRVQYNEENNPGA
jgi:hypothetical protein